MKIPPKKHKKDLARSPEAQDSALQRTVGMVWKVTVTALRGVRLCIFGDFVDVAALPN